jgi:DNA-binding MarR family transcriptional regulator
MAGQHYTVESLQPDNSVGYLIKRCGILVTQIAEQRFKSQPISFMQWAVLYHLTEYPRVSPTQLSANLGHDMGALTRLADDLEQQGLVRRERSEKDRRGVQIMATAEGRRLALVTKAAVVELVNELVEPYSKAETEMLISLLQRMLLRMQEVAEGLTAGSVANDPKIIVNRQRAVREPRVRARQASNRRRKSTR